MRVKVENFFPNVKHFLEVARPLTRGTEENILTEQEIYRLKKFILKVKGRIVHE